MGQASANLKPAANEPCYTAFENLIKAMKQAYIQNPWFTPDNIAASFRAWSYSLSEQKIRQWLNPYVTLLADDPEPRKTAVIMAGNIPLAGLHDLICVLISGNSLLGKVSADDACLLPAIAGLLCAIEPSFGPLIEFSTEKMSGFDMVIATGSNNTSRYFEQYFAAYPHIIRHNRNGIAVLNGHETPAELENLGHDIFSYFGLGCRSVSMMYVPENYDFSRFSGAVAVYRDRMIMHHKYMNNYTYRKTIFMLNNTPFIDGGFFLACENQDFISPISVIHYFHYKSLPALAEYLENEQDNIQCILSNISTLQHAVPLGKGQQPELWDWADGTDTLKFLLENMPPFEKNEQGAVK